MTTLTVIKFPTAGGAEEALSILKRLRQQHLIEVLDAAVVSWPLGRKGPKTRQASQIASTGAGLLGGGFWGLLFGLLFFMPLLGFALGALTGALAGSLADYGIDDDFIRQTREKITPGTSALFLLSASAVADRVVPELKTLRPELVTTNLSTEQEDRLRELFAEDEPVHSAA